MENGTIGWVDLTVDDADTVQNFYREVAGWAVEPVDMGEYSDFNMIAASTGNPTAGVCHARGSNADLPSVWMIYINVADIERSVQACTDLGGEVIAPPRGLAGGRFCVIKDPAGAVCALFQPPL